MSQESIVYGCIKDVVVSGSGGEIFERRRLNRQVMGSLPSVEDWPLLAREMFSAAPEVQDIGDVRTDVIHFGNSYKAIEHEWNEWIAQFEAVLRRMYWSSVTVHLETELNGTHTFVWETEQGYHLPNQGGLGLRCQWSHEAAY